MFIEKIRHLFILKGFVGHNMTPMTGSVTNGKKNGLVLISRFLKGLISPGIPVNGIFSMLQQVGALAAGQPVTSFFMILHNTHVN